MAEPPKTWAIILALQVQLQTITVANGYLTDAGLNVWTTDGQRPDTEALGLMIYSDSITGTPSQRPGKPVRQFPLLIEFAIGNDIDNAQQQAHALIEDIDRCMEAYSKAQVQKPSVKATPMEVVDIAILDRPDGEAVIAGQVRVMTTYFR
jgi:hypothetical protein